MDTQKAREVLGKDAEGIPDGQLEKEIEVATLFKNILFDMLSKNKLQETPKNENTR